MSNVVPRALTAYREALENGLCRLPGKAPDVWTILCLKWYNDKTGLASPGLRKLAEDLYGPLLPGPEVTYTDKRGVVRPAWLRTITSLRRALTCLEHRGWVKMVLKPTQGRATGYAVLSSPCPKSDRDETPPCPEADRENAPPCPETSASLSISATTTPFERPMVYGVPKRNVEAAETDRDRPQGRRIPHIEHEDLRDTPKLLGLFKQFADLGIVADCEGDRVDFVACAESVLRIENGNPAGLFAERLRNWPKRRGWVSHADEENAARRLRALRGA